MAYATYTTEAIVCGTFNRNTADRSYLLFTREAGMLYADARSVREERSRQRFGLQDFSYIRVSLVKGKAGWKIGSTESRGNFYQQAVDQAARGSIVSLSRFLRRFYQGEEATPELFDFVLASYESLVGVLKERSFVELASQVRILSLLGYVGHKDVPDSILQATPRDFQALHTRETRDILSRLLEHAVTVSHL